MPIDNDFSEILAPLDYRQFFTKKEFKFRWLQALMEEQAPWRRGREMYTALMLAYFMDSRGLCYPSVDRLAEAMCKSPDTVRRALKALANNGWLVIQYRTNMTNLYQAVLPDHAFQRLMESRHRENEPSPFVEVYACLGQVINQICPILGISRAQLEASPEHPRLTGKLTQIIQRMQNREHDVQKLVQVLCEELPQHVHSPHGFMMKRADEFARAYGATGKRRASRSNESSPTFDEMVNKAADALRRRPAK